MEQRKKYNTTTENAASLEYGKVPPQAVDLEEAVLGAVMLEKDAIVAVLDILKPESFYKETHQKIYRAIIALFMENSPVDMLTVSSQLKKTKELEEIGGAAFLAQLTHKVASSAHIEFHSHIIQQKYIQRELIRASSEILAKAYDDSIDVDDLIDESESRMFEISSGNIKRETQSISDLLKEAIKKIQEVEKRDTHLVGIPSGFTKLDRITTGWQPSDLIIVAARPSMGKTAFVLSMARNITVDHHKTVALFSLEMSSIQLVNRLIVSETELAVEKIKTGSLTHDEWKQLDYKIKPLENARLFIDDTPGITVFELRAKCRRLKQEHNIDIIIIDYLQLMTGPSDVKNNREQEVSTISRSLKALAKELDVPVIALSQLNRMVETRGGNKRPQLSDLRESGAIEQDADIVLFIHRPEKYGIDVFDDDQSPTKGVAEIVLAKHRNGPTGDVRLRFKETYAKFSDMEEIIPLDESIISAYTVGSRMNRESSEGNDLGSSFDSPPSSGDQPF
jgi:replicative DNA helicase